MACMRTQFFYPLAITVLLNGCASPVRGSGSSAKASLNVISTLDKGQK